MSAGTARESVVLEAEVASGGPMEELAGPASYARSVNQTWQKRKRKQRRGQREGRAGRSVLGGGVPQEDEQDTEGLEGRKRKRKGIGSHPGEAVMGRMGECLDSERPEGGLTTHQGGLARWTHGGEAGCE